MNGAGHIENPIIGMILACEEASSWDVFDTTITAVIPEVDDKKVAVVGDGQKGELASHKNRFKQGLLRSCYRHRGEEFKGLWGWPGSVGALRVRPRRARNPCRNHHPDV